MLCTYMIVIRKNDNRMSIVSLTDKIKVVNVGKEW